MIEVVDLQKYERDYCHYYSGRSGVKYPVIINGERWMIKFPRTSSRFSEVNNQLLPNITNPLREYIGSHIYEALEIPVHETILGYREDKIVVACKDFDPMRAMVPYRNIRNSITEETAALSKLHSNSGELLSDVLTVLDTVPALKNNPSITQRFWDMFVVDAFICNNNRDNNNWGFFIDEDSIATPAPVFDNGGAFSSEKNSEITRGHLKEDVSMQQDSYGIGISFFLGDNGSHINPFDYIESAANPDCTDALIRFMYRIKLDEVCRIIDDIPESAFGLKVIQPAVKQHYKTMLFLAYTKCFVPILDKMSK